MYTFVPSGICSKEIQFNILEGAVKDVVFLGGCSGNLLGISKLIEGMNVNEAITKLRGIACGTKKTSCPDQLAIALEEALLEEAV